MELNMGSMDEMSDEQKRYLQFLKEWKDSGSRIPFKDFVMARGLTETQYNTMMRKHG